jgi:hypothetical protein
MNWWQGIKDRRQTWGFGTKQGLNWMALSAEKKGGALASHASQRCALPKQNFTKNTALFNCSGKISTRNVSFLHGD